jgi:hypothetical protein
MIPPNREQVAGEGEGVEGEVETVNADSAICHIEPSAI